MEGSPCKILLMPHRTLLMPRRTLLMPRRTLLMPHRTLLMLLRRPCSSTHQPFFTARLRASEPASVTVSGESA